MKATWITVLMALILGAAIMYIYQVNKTPKNFVETTKFLNKEDLNKINYWDAIFGQNPGLPTKEKSFEIHREYAKACIDQYKKIANSSSTQIPAVNMLLKTTAVGFAGQEIGLWAAKLPFLSGYTHLNVEFGVYINPENDHENNYGIEPEEMSTYVARYNDKKDQLTVFLWPCKSPLGTHLDANPFNFGDLQP